MKTVFSVIGLLVPAILLAPVSSLRDCPSSFTHVDGAVNGCYKLVLKKMTWDDAVARCQQLNPRAHLVIVDSAEKQQAVENIMRPLRSLVDSNCFHPGYYPAVMIGAQRIDPADGTSPFVWKLPGGGSRPLEYTHWNRGEPNNDATHIEECAKIYPDWGYRWNDAPCWMEACLMCEIDI